MSRPLVVPCLLFAAGIGAGDSLGGDPSWLWIGFVAACCWVFLGGRIRLCGLWSGFFVAGWLAWVLQQTPLNPSDLRWISDPAGEFATVQGVLSEAPALRVTDLQGTVRSRTTVRVSIAALLRSGRWEPASGDVVATLPGVLGPEYFRTRKVEIRGVLKGLRGPRARGLFDGRTYFAQQGIWRILETEGSADWQWVDRNPVSPPLSERFLPWAQARLAAGLPDDEATRLLAAMALGWKTPLTGEVDTAFMESGTLHVFAISGLHIALIAGLLVQLLRLFRIPRGCAGILAIPCVWFYVAATGWQASAVRSAVMTSVIAAGWAMERPSDLVNSLAAAALVILVPDPGQLLQAGFQLSFVAVAGLAVVTPRLQPLFLRWINAGNDPFLPANLRPRWRQWLDVPLRWLALSLATGCAATLGTLPLIWHFFHLVNPVSLLANLVVVPLSSLALAANFSSRLVGGGWPWLGEVFNASAWVWMNGMVSGSRLCAGIPGGHAYVAAPFWLWWVPYYLLLASGCRWGGMTGRFRRVWGAVAAGWLVAGGAAWARHRTVSEITLLARGEAVWTSGTWRTPAHLMDAGSVVDPATLLVPFLQARGVERIPLLILSRRDRRHIGGLNEVVNRFHPGLIIVPEGWPRNLEALTQAFPPELQMVRVHRGDFAGEWRVLHPGSGGRPTGAGAGSLVLLRDFGGIRVAWMSDLGAVGQKRMIGEGMEPVDIVLAAPSSASEPLSEGVLEQLNPQLIVVATEAAPSPRRVRRSTLARLRARGIHVVCTDRSGAVTLRMEEGVARVESMEGEAFDVQPRSAATRTPDPH